MTKKSNYIKYCLKGGEGGKVGECQKKDGCFHFLNPKVKFKDKILIYGPNGSGKSSLIKELISQSKTSENSNNQNIMVFDDVFIHRHIFQINEETNKKKSNNENDKKLITKKQSSYSKKQALPNVLAFHTKDLKQWREEKQKYENQLEQLKNDWEEWDNQLFKWFFEIISDEKKQKLPKVRKDFLASWKKYWETNNDLIKKNYNQKDYDWLKESWTWSFDNLKEQISNNFQINDSVLKNIKNDFDNKNNKYSKTNFFHILKKQKQKIKTNSQNILKEIAKHKKFLESSELNENIFKVWSDNLNLEMNQIKKFFSSLEDKSKILIWYQKGIKLYEDFNLNDNKCIFCFQQYLIKEKKMYSKLKSYDEKDNELLPNLKKIQKIYNKVLTTIEEISEELNQIKVTIPGLKKGINKIVDSNKSKINFEPKKFVPSELVNFCEEINRYLSDYLVNNESKDESISDNFIEKNFEKNDFKKIIIEIKSARKWFENNLLDEIECLRKKIKEEEKELQDELQDELDIIQKNWNFPIKIKLENSKKSQNALIKIIGENGEDVIRFLSVGELKGLAIIIFFLYLKRNMSKNKQETASNNLIIFDDVFDGLDFTAAFRFNNLLEWLIEDTKKSNEKSKPFPKMILLTHQFDFITFFHNQDENNNDENEKNTKQNDDNEEQKFDFFRLFKKDDEPKHTFIRLNLNKLIQTKLMVFRKYLNKMLNQFEKYTSNEQKRLPSDLIDQIIFWSISRLTLEIILTNKLNLQGEKINHKNFMTMFKKYLNTLFEESESKENIKENLAKILKKWKPYSNTFVYVSKENDKNDKNKTFNISQKNLFLMTQAIKDFLFKIKVITQKENIEFEKQINFLSNKYKENNDIVKITKKSYKNDFFATIKLEELENRLKFLLEKLCPKNNTFQKEKNEIKDIQKEDLYVEYVLLQRAIFFLRGKCQKVEELKEYYSNLFTFLRHAHNNFFPSLLMFDASFEKILESAK